MGKEALWGLTGFLSSKKALIRADGTCYAASRLEKSNHLIRLLRVIIPEKLPDRFCTVVAEVRRAGKLCYASSS